jgi:hypothetical protein
VESVLPTYNDGDGRWRAGDGEAIQATLVDGGGGFWWSFSLGVDSRGGGGAGDPPPGGGSVRESLSRHGAGGLAWKQER